MAAMEPALFRMLRAGRSEGRVLDSALDGLAQVFGRRAAAARVGPHVTCAEADRIAWVLISSRHTDAAAVWLNGHAEGDDDEDLHGGDDFDAIAYITGRH
jgi:hypothetical protein